MNSTEPNNTDADTSKVALLSGDLMFASKIQVAAQRAGHEFYFGGNLPNENTSSIRYVFLDLATRSSLTDKLVDLCKESCPDAITFAFGPHVDVDKLGAAKKAGIQYVLTRGQLVNTLPELLSL